MINISFSGIYFKDRDKFAIVIPLVHNNKIIAFPAWEFLSTTSLSERVTPHDTQIEGSYTEICVTDKSGQGKTFYVERGEYKEAKRKINEAFFEACRANVVQVVRILLVNPMLDVNATDSSGETALMTAFEMGHFDVVEELLKVPVIRTQPFS